MEALVKDSQGHRLLDTGLLQIVNPTVDSLPTHQMSTLSGIAFFFGQGFRNPPHIHRTIGKTGT